MKITSLEDIQNMPVMVRVLDSTDYPSEVKKQMIGGTFEVRSIFYYENSISIWNKDKSNWYDFNLSDIQYLTPVFFEGYQIGIGDRIARHNGEELEVFGYSWCGGEWGLDCAEIEDGKPDYSDTFYFRESEITSATPLYPKVSSEQIEEATKLLEKAGKIKEGRIIL
jgi:hypothetical protein